MNRLVETRFVRVVALGLLISLVAAPVQAFDTKWHMEATAYAARERGFSPTATTALQLGTFAPDLFGPLADKLDLAIVSAGIDLMPAVKRLAFQPSAAGSTLRKAGRLLHFDNIEGSVRDKEQLRGVFRCLQRSTQQTINDVYAANNVSEADRKLVILLAVGSSLHMVQDFYAHSSWIDGRNVITPPNLAPPREKALARLVSKGELRPTDPYVDTWAWDCVGADCTNDDGRSLTTGIYPDNHDDEERGLSHSAMNHDSTNLPSKHCAKPCEWKEHQRVAAATAARASAEWIAKLTRNEKTAKAIAWAATLADAPQSTLIDVETLSCALDHWDGPGACTVITWPTIPKILDASVRALVAAVRGRPSGRTIAVATAVVAVTSLLGAAFTANTAAQTFRERSNGIHELYVTHTILEDLSKEFGDAEQGRYSKSIATCGP